VNGAQNYHKKLLFNMFTGFCHRHVFCEQADSAQTPPASTEQMETKNLQAIIADNNKNS
jgi:hypothetical protein